MKHFNLALFLGCCVISAGIALGCYFIAVHMPWTPSFPSQLTVSDGTIQYPEYLSKGEACDYLTVGESHLDTLISEGKLKGAYVQINGLYVFNRDALAEAFNKLMLMQ